MGFRHLARVSVVVGALGVLTACSSVYYSALEKVGLEKRYETLSGEDDGSRKPAGAVRERIAGVPRRGVPRPRSGGVDPAVSRSSRG